jgi:SAM-dependent methyltransferase
MDFMKEALVQARRTSQEFATPISLIEGDIINIPLKDNAVDLAWNIGTLEHFDDPVAVIREMRRVSNVSISFVPADLIIWKIYKLVCRMLGYPKEEEEKCRLYSKDLLRKEFEEAGYSNVIVKKVYDVLFPFYAGIGIR